MPVTDLEEKYDCQTLDSTDKAVPSEDQNISEAQNASEIETVAADLVSLDSIVENTSSSTEDAVKMYNLNISTDSETDISIKLHKLNSGVYEEMDCNILMGPYYERKYLI